MHIKYALTR